MSSIAPSLPVMLEGEPPKAPEKRCLVALCCNTPMIYRQTAQSLMELGWGDRVARAKEAHGFTEISFMWATTFPRVDALRDSVAALAMQEGFSHILYLDADMVWPTDTLMRMLAHHDQGIVGGLYVMRHPPFAPVALRDGKAAEGSEVLQYQHAREGLTETELVPCDVLGMGCTLVPVSVFDAIGPRPWFAYANDDEGWPCVTEDVPFCQKAQKAGYGIWLDPTISCGHVTQQVVDRKTAIRYQKDSERVAAAMPIRIVERPTEAA